MLPGNLKCSVLLWAGLRLAVTGSKTDGATGPAQELIT